MSKTTKSTDRFEEYRARGLDLSKKSGASPKSSVTDEPFILGPEHGFDPEIRIEKPVFTDRLSLAEASQRKDVVGMLRIIFKADFARFLNALNAQGDDADLIALGVATAVLEHFYGSGIGEAVGGFPTLLS